MCPDITYAHNILKPEKILQVLLSGGKQDENLYGYSFNDRS